jgi:hypothetical protein
MVISPYIMIGVITGRLTGGPVTGLVFSVFNAYTHAHIRGSFQKLAANLPVDRSSIPRTYVDETNSMSGRTRANRPLGGRQPISQLAVRTAAAWHDGIVFCFGPGCVHLGTDMPTRLRFGEVSTSK